MEEELKCTRTIKVIDGYDRNGRPLHHHERCNLPAKEVEVAGLLATAKAVLCSQHRLAADREAFISENGFKMGKINKNAKEKGYVQRRLPGTGLK